MNLQDLPLELFCAIITETVWTVGIFQAFHLRLVSNTVDRMDLSNVMHPARKMGTAITRKLVLSKMSSKNSDRRPLAWPSQTQYRISSKTQGALIAAISTNQTNLAKQLLQGGVDPMARSAAFGMPLEFAAAVGTKEIVKLILDELLEKRRKNSSRASKVDEASRQAALQGMIKGGHMNIGRMILDRISSRRYFFAAITVSTSFDEKTTFEDLVTIDS
ncbi:hypothetical protein K458DRAFT_407896 [Lentithecium fluviatile CBS 122367]|uniref:Uncharacterized protein n=1 Tax=Lentithecium fluviatile CBS 122367 TaxID=1168545 RepID=A0A6G1INX4_9PLEO|nr:hypothetical protein K458DRAFT_407896 [Lentithecium fluviatile CBS 122367]